MQVTGGNTQTWTTKKSDFSDSSVRKGSVLVARPEEIVNPVHSKSLLGFVLDEYRQLPEQGS